ncbi:MAG: hypothetical protein HY832_01395, partial [Candidatus Aenigmarchaeota archaeon]|nr:hypothetical protein [Candidatus Aenigmarchaeota archaeon]
TTQRVNEEQAFTHLVNENSQYYLASFNVVAAKLDITQQCTDSYCKLLDKNACAASNGLCYKSGSSGSCEGCPIDNEMSCSLYDSYESEVCKVCSGIKDRCEILERDSKDYCLPKGVVVEEQRCKACNSASPCMSSQCLDVPSSLLSPGCFFSPPTGFFSNSGTCYLCLPGATCGSFSPAECKTNNYKPCGLSCRLKDVDRQTQKCTSLCDVTTCDELSPDVCDKCGLYCKTEYDRGTPYCTSACTSTTVCEDLPLNTCEKNNCGLFCIISRKTGVDACSGVESS